MTASSQDNTIFWHGWCRNIRFLISTGAKRSLHIIGAITVVFFIIWQYRASLGNKRYSIPTVKINEERFRYLTFFTVEHARKLKQGFGGQVNIKYLNGALSRGRGNKNNIALKNVKPIFPKRIESATADNRSVYTASQKPTRFVRVPRYWEMMSMNVRALITLAGQAKFGNRKVQAPRVKNSEFGTNGGYPLGIYFNITHFNQVLTLAKYATLVGEEDYEAECSLADVSHVAIYFLYEGGEKETKWFLRLNERQHYFIRKKAGKFGWTKCLTAVNYIRENSKTEVLCVNVSMITEWEKLENKVIRGAKCLTLLNWRGIGSSFRTHFSDKHFKFHANDVQFALKPSGAVLKEANRFRRALHGPYIAVHVRADKVFTAHSLSGVLECVRVLADLVKVLKVVSDITQVFVASDTSRFGSYGWVGQYKHRTLKSLHSFLVSSIGGIEYKPTADDADRGVVALVEMTLLARATHLITVGTGSFQEWVKAKFLEQHRDDDQRQWSLITMCVK